MSTTGTPTYIKIIYGQYEGLTGYIMQHEKVDSLDKIKEDRILCTLYMATIPIQRIIPKSHIKILK